MKQAPIVRDFALFGAVMFSLPFLLGAVVSGVVGGVTGWPTSSATKEITWANSLASAVRIGNGTTPMCFYTDDTQGALIRPCTASNIRTHILTNFNYGWFDDEGDADMFVVDPDAASPNAMYQFSAGYRPRKTVYWGAAAISVDGTQCATPAESANTLVKQFTIVCADNDGGILYGSAVMPDAWDGGTVTFKWTIAQVAASTQTVEMDFAAKCVSNDEALTAFGTPPTGEQAASITLTADNDMLSGTTAAVTVDGTTCAGGDTLFWTGQVDATASGANIATAVETIGVSLEYTVNSLSD